MPKGMNPTEHNEPDDVFIGPMPYDPVTPVDPWAFWPTEEAPEIKEEVVLPKIAFNRPEIASVSAEKCRKQCVVMKRRRCSEIAAQRLARATERAQKQSDKQRKSIKKK